ncbi:hypothetical protein Apmu_0197_03 [Acidiphilium multivorum AIU301]|nr:hypothetical protein Apmu_0197_03 [Acidiphilium multivorum AIU301]
MIFRSRIFLAFRPTQARFLSSIRGRSKIGVPAAVRGFAPWPLVGRSGRDDRHKVAGVPRLSGRGGDGEVAHGRQTVDHVREMLTLPHHQPGRDGGAKALHGSP